MIAGNALRSAKTASNISVLFQKEEIGVTFRKGLRKRQWEALMIPVGEKLGFTDGYLIANPPQHWLHPLYRRQP